MLQVWDSELVDWRSATRSMSAMQARTGAEDMRTASPSGLQMLATTPS